jgi:hypothetical protein
MKNMALTLALALHAAAAADAADEEVWSALRAAPWGATYEKWTRPGGAASCERFRGPGSVSRADEEWAYRCRRDDAGAVREWFFYVFPGDPPAPRLEQFRARISAPVGPPSAGPATALEECYRALAERISGRYGAAERPSDLTVHEFGSAFLARHPASPARADIEFMVAQAYETWWSLPQASPEDDYVEPARYQAGAATAREKAIALYKDVLRLAPSGPEATYARPVLPRLALGFDTGQRRFFCVED